MGIFEIIFKLALAAVLGGLIGLERESLNRPAGLRTTPWSALVRRWQW